MEPAMPTTNPSKNLATMVADLEEEAVLSLVQNRIDAGDDPLQIIEECNAGMRLVGQKYENGEYFVSGLIMSGEIFREVVEIIHPHLKKLSDGKSSGVVLLGTVAGDIHDIGKNMAATLLSCYGFTVIDLGVDVPPATFAEKVIEVKPDIVGISGLITASFETMKATIAILREKAHQHQQSFPIIVGGGMIDEQICHYVGADYWVKDAMSGVRLCQRLMERTGKAQ
jgi:methylmalonyl-CoA mutase cobalamin-binding domain/chain